MNLIARSSIYAFLIIVQVGNLHSSPLSSCYQLVQEMLSTSRKVTLDAQEISFLAEFQKRYPPLYRFGSLEEREQFIFLSELPDSILEKLLSLPAHYNQDRAIKYLAHLRDSHNESGGIFAQSIEWLMKRLHYGQQDEFLAWLRQGIEGSRGLSRSAKQSTLDKIREMGLKRLMVQLFDQSFYRQHSMIQKSGGRYLKVGESEYRVLSVRDEGVEILVPREKVKTPADNPLDHHKMAEMVSNASTMLFSLRKSRYEVNIGLDDFFYIVDGNHRFQLFENRDWIPVVIPPHLRSVPLQNHLILRGGLPFSEEVILRVVKNGENPLDYLPSHEVAKMRWRLEELEQIPIPSP